MSSRPISAHERIGVVGAGIVGLATARAIQLRRPDATVRVFEKEPDVGRHQTARNSGVVHAGIYYPPGSLKAQLCRRGLGMLRSYCQERSLPYIECGKLIIAVDDAEVPALHKIHERALANGVPGVRLIDAAGIRDIEPHATGRLALHSPETAIADFAAVARSFAREVLAAGGQIATGAEVEAVDHRDGEVVVHTTAGAFPLDRLVTCAGLHSDKVAALSGDHAGPRIIPFRGDYYRLVKQRRHLVRGLIYPVPDPRYPFLGVHLTRRTDGEVLVGPNAVLAFAREGYRFTVVNPRDLWQIFSWPGFRKLARQHWRTGIDEVVRALSRQKFVAEARRYVNTLEVGDVVRSMTGVRAQALDESGDLVDDFRITRRGRVVNVRNAPSPAATSSLAIAERIADAVLE